MAISNRRSEESYFAQAGGDDDVLDDNCHWPHSIEKT